MPQSKLNELKKEIQRLRPEIMELKFGCLLKNKYTETSYDKFNLFIKRSGENFIVFRPSFNVTGSFPNDTFEILGRPITLEDVLAVLGERLNDKFRDSFFYENGHFHIGNLVWKLGESFDNQNKEFHDGLFDLICK